jgi:hypothetical protein
VIPVEGSTTKVRLAEVLDDALAETPVPVDLDLGQGGAGSLHRLRLDLDPLIGSGSSHNLGVGFEPAAAVAAEQGTIDLGYAHSFVDGQQVLYSHGGGASVDGLENKGTYYAIVVDPTTVRLAESYAKALDGAGIALDASTAQGTAHTIGVGFRSLPIVDRAANAIRFEGTHGFRRGQAVVYDSGGGNAIGGLLSGATYYANPIDSGRIGLARSALEAQEDPATFFGPDDLDDSGGLGTAVDLGYLHGFQPGDSVVYRNGGGASIGNLVDGQTYYVLPVAGSETSLQLSVTPAGPALTLDPGQGEGTAHSLRLALDPSEASGTGHRLLEPDDALEGSLSSVGKTTVKATNDGLLVAGTLAAVKTGDKPSPKQQANAKEASGGGGKYGFAVSGSASVNTVWDTTEAYVSDSVIAQSDDLELLADESTRIWAFAGSGALTTNKKGGLGVAGAVTVNTIDNDTRAYIHDSSLSDVGALTLHSQATGRIIGIAAGLAGAPRGVGIAGSVAVNRIYGETEAYIDGGTVVSGVTDLVVEASDTSSIVAVAGALAYGGKAGVGAGVAVNIIDGSAQAFVADSDVAASGGLTLLAKSDSDIFAISAAVGIGKGSMAAGISVTVNLVSNETSAWISGKRTEDGVETDGAVSISATDESDITAIAGGVAIAAGKGPKKDNATWGATLGAAIAVNDISNTVEALVLDAAAVRSAGEIGLIASSMPTIYALTVAGSLTNAGSKKGGLSFSGAGAGSGNTIENTVEAAIRSGSSVETTGTGSVKLTATDGSAITADAGGVGIAIARGEAATRPATSSSWRAPPRRSTR